METWVAKIVLYFNHRVAKPGSTPEEPHYYGPTDFSLGSIIDVFGTRFVITDADEYVIKFMEANRNQFSDELINSLSAKVVSQMNQKKVKDERSRCKGGPANLQRTQVASLILLKLIYKNTWLTKSQYKNKNV